MCGIVAGRFVTMENAAPAVNIVNIDAMGGVL